MVYSSVFSVSILPKWLNNSFGCIRRRLWDGKWQTSFGNELGKHDPKGHESEPSLVWKYLEWFRGRLGLLELSHFPIHLVNSFFFEFWGCVLCESHKYFAIRIILNLNWSIIFRTFVHSETNIILCSMQERKCKMDLHFCVIYY